MFDDEIYGIMFDNDEMWIVINNIGDAVLIWDGPMLDV